MNKTKLIAISIMAGFFCICALAQTYWPHDTNKYPIRYETNIGQGYVVGTNNAAVQGSIAIGANDIDEKAIVLDAQNAAQIGEGTNTVDNTLQFHGNAVSLVFYDSGTNTDTSAYSAPMAGCILVGKFNDADEIWVSKGTGTNWNRTGEATIAPGTIDGVDIDPAAAGDSLTVNGSQLDVDDATTSAKGAMYLPNIVQFVKTDIQQTTSAGDTNRTDIADLSVAITPKSTDSKIRITATIYGCNGVAGDPVFLFLQKDGTDLIVGDLDGAKQRATAVLLDDDDTVRAVDCAHIDYIDSPATTSETTYKIQIASPNGSQANINLNPNEADNTEYARFVSVITAEEIYQ